MRVFCTSAEHIVFAEPRSSFIASRRWRAGCRSRPCRSPRAWCTICRPWPRPSRRRRRVMFIANPNNPTGTHVGRAAVEKLLREVPSDVIIVMDEAYFEYADAPDYPDSLQLAQPS